MSAVPVSAFLALWNSISPAHQAEYEIWHSMEHVPERTSLPGFVEARRYRSLAAPLHYFTWYGVAALTAFETGGYQNLLSHPTPWSARMRPHLGDFLRLPCGLAGQLGSSTGAYLAVGVWDTQPQALPRLEQVLRQPREHQGVTAVQWGQVADMGAYPVAVLGQQASNAASTHGPACRMVVLLQGIAPDPLTHSMAGLQRAVEPFSQPVRLPEVYALQNLTRQRDLSPIPGQRPPPRHDLFNAFQQGDSL
ncbi:MAG: hypothetical protein RLZZ401_286 [Pseudomonadota bacterium]|jgi:hypothetical protein